MGFLSNLINGPGSSNDRKEIDPDQDMEVRQKISEAVALKRQGKFSDSIDIYNNLIRKYPDDPRAYKSIGKVLVCTGEYDLAIQQFHKGAILYDQHGASGESWQCRDQASTVSNRDANPDEFYSYAMGCAGGAPGFTPKL